jgi:flagellar biosynthesis/type III secretory pathway ATPase
MNIINPINVKYAAKMQRAYKWLRTYHELVNIDSPTKGQERQQETAFYKYVDILDELPQREQKTFEAQHKKLHGYT